MSRSRLSQRLDEGVGSRLTPALTADAALSPGWVCGDHRYAGGLCAVGLRFAGEHRDGGVRPTLLRVREEVCVALECRAAADAVRARQREAGITSLCSSRAIPTESIARGPDREASDLLSAMSPRGLSRGRRQRVCRCRRRVNCGLPPLTVRRHRSWFCNASNGSTRLKKVVLKLN